MLVIQNKWITPNLQDVDIIWELYNAGNWANSGGLIRPLYGLYMAFIRPFYGLYTLYAIIRPFYGHYTAITRPLYSLYKAIIQPLYSLYTVIIRPLYGLYTAVIRSLYGHIIFSYYGTFIWQIWESGNTNFDNWNVKLGYRN